MTLSDIKRINIREYLGRMGISPAKENNRYGIYNSPFREDHNASMKVDYNQNLWIDYGTGEGGSIIDLVYKLEKCSVCDAIKKLDGNSFSFHRNALETEEKQKPEPEPIMRITGIAPINSLPLIDYFHERKINIEIARLHCKEINYSVNGKSYFAVAFPNNAGGYELRSKYFKGCIAPKDITHIRQKETQDSCYVFEGFMDYLSFIVLWEKHNSELPNIDKQDYIVLNSVSNVQKAIPQLVSYGNIHCFLDNDVAGKRAFQKIQEAYALRVRDASKHYANYKDLNDYLCSRSVPKQAVRIKPSKGIRM